MKLFFTFIDFKLTYCDQILPQSFYFKIIIKIKYLQFISTKIDYIKTE